MSNKNYPLGLKIGSKINLNKEFFKNLGYNYSPKIKNILKSGTVFSISIFNYFEGCDFVSVSFKDKKSNMASLCIVIENNSIYSVSVFSDNITVNFSDDVDGLFNYSAIGENFSNGNKKEWMNVLSNKKLVYCGNSFNLLMDSVIGNSVVEYDYGNNNIKSRIESAFTFKDTQVTTEECIQIILINDEFIELYHMMNIPQEVLTIS